MGARHGIERCLKFIAYGDSEPETVRATLTDLERRKRSIEAQIGEGNVEDVVEFHPNVSDLFRRKVGELSVLLQDENSRSEAMDVIRSLINRIEVRPGTKRGQPESTLVGAWAGILDFASNTNKRDSSGEHNDGRVLLVAGVGFEPTTFRL